MYRIRSALQMKPGFSLLKIPFHHLHVVEVYTTPEISPHDSPAGSSLWLSQGPNCLSRLGHACRRGEPGGWRAPPGQFSSAAGSQEPLLRRCSQTRHSVPTTRPGPPPGRL